MCRLPSNSDGFDEEEVYPLKIVSGGQAGVDRAALDVALELGMDAGGWCPRGRLAEDGPIPERYPLRQTASKTYAVRTEWNVRDSDATLILYRGKMRGGTLLTAKLAHRYGRPLLALDLHDGLSVEQVRRWLSDNRVRVLNLAGPRESGAPGIHAEARSLLLALLEPYGRRGRRLDVDG